MSISKDFVNIYKDYLKEINNYKKTIKYIENMVRKVEKKHITATEEEIKLVEKEELTQDDEFTCNKNKIYCFSNGDKYIGKIEQNELHGQGYYIMYDNDKVIMASGSFTQGSSIEISCDGPIRAPYIAYMQGGLTYEYGKLGILKAIEHMKKI